MSVEVGILICLIVIAISLVTVSICGVIVLTVLARLISDANKTVCTVRNKIDNLSKLSGIIGIFIRLFQSKRSK
ncbi:MAG: hypothetical protein LBC07_01875 [Elusimicrobiota bacterium]|nr:hypothetical protein [Elusimicrobiota bacterium]